MSKKLEKPNQQNNAIVVDDGSKVYDIVNKRGKKLGEFEFRPSDTNIVKRYEEVVDFFNSFSILEDSEKSMQEAESQIVDKMCFRRIVY